MIDSLDATRTLASEWSTLGDSAAGVAPFQSPDWLLPWYEVWAADRIRVITARDRRDGHLLGLIPAVVSPSRLELAGSGVGDYLAPMLGPDAGDDVAAALDEALAARSDTCLFHDVPADSPWIAFARTSSAWVIAPASVCPVISLPPTPDEWRRTLSPGLQRNLRRYGNRMIDEADARFFTVATVEQLVPVLDALFELHSRRWHDQQRPGVFADAAVRRFHHLSAPALLASGALALHVLQCGDAVVAAQYVLVRGERAYSYIGGFDPAWNRYSPGSLLMAYSIERAIDEGCVEFDLLRGAESYKYTWGAADRTTLSLSRRVDHDAA